MASGRSHDRATGLLAIPFGLLWWPALGPLGFAIAGSAFLLGGLWLSPDLDVLSRSSRRWGPLGLLWWPYRRVLRHRSLLSHSPLLGSGLRLVWLSAWMLLLVLVLEPIGLLSLRQVLEVGQWMWQQQRPLLLAALVGIEASSWLHLLQDGDPLPKRPRLFAGRRRRKRR
ncbi:MAG: metal-binding protein [Synechococcaceae cyanobacterium]|nr:metal-binding protein [Synechococcaceae cyanobacterium]